MKKFFKNFLVVIQGAVFGIANVIPGVSGSTMAVIMGIYEKIIEILSNVIKGIKKNWLFIILFFAGIILGILGGATVITIALEKMPIPVILLFCGFVIGGLPSQTAEVKKGLKNPVCYVTFISTLALAIGLSYLPIGSSVDLAVLNVCTVLFLFLIGFVCSAAMIIPGISGSLVLMSIGYYQPIMNAVSSLVTFSDFWHDILILLPFGIGCIAGILLLSKLLKLLLEKFRLPSLAAILGFLVASPFLVVKEGLFDANVTFDTIQIVIGVVLLILGALFTFILTQYQRQSKTHDSNDNANE